MIPSKEKLNGLFIYIQYICEVIICFSIFFAFSDTTNKLHKCVNYSIYRSWTSGARGVMTHSRFSLRQTARGRTAAHHFTTTDVLQHTPAAQNQR